MGNAPPVMGELWRGDLVEAEFRGVLAVMGVDGELVASAGDVEYMTYLRSSSKPFQAIAMVESGAAERFGLSPSDIAIVAASHAGEPIHVAAVRSVLGRIALGEEALECGVHPPADAAAAQALLEAGEEPGSVHNNCSGKHAGMLALARHIDAPLEAYLAPEHPVQQRALRVIAEMSDVPAPRILLGVDGCGVPTFGLPIRNIARMFARLVCPEGAPERLRDACRLVYDAMTSHPELIAGTAGRWDTELMRAARGDIASKGGAEGLACCGVRSRGVGVALKSADGSGRANAAIMMHVLSRLQALSEDAVAELHEWDQPVVKNHRGETVGRIQTAGDAIVWR